MLISHVGPMILAPCVQGAIIFSVTGMSCTSHYVQMIRWQCFFWYKLFLTTISLGEFFVYAILDCKGVELKHRKVQNIGYG